MNIFHVYFKNCCQKYDKIYVKVVNIFNLRHWSLKQISFEDFPKKINLLKLLFLVFQFNFILIFWRVSYHRKGTENLNKLWIWKLFQNCIISLLNLGNYRKIWIDFVNKLRNKSCEGVIFTYFHCFWSFIVYILWYFLKQLHTLFLTLFCSF